MAKGYSLNSYNILTVSTFFLSLFRYDGVGVFCHSGHILFEAFLFYPWFKIANF